MGERLSIALIGCGRISKKHFDLIETLPGLKLVGVCDIRKERADALARLAGVPAFDRHAAMARTLRPDIVTVLVESGAHGRVACDVAPYTANLILEKPMTLTLDDADTLLETCERCGVSLFVVQQNRYNRPVVHLRRAVAKGRFGKLVLGSVRLRWRRTQEYYDQDPWRGSVKDDGGLFANQASHHVDLLQSLMGPVERVQAYTARRLVQIETEDTGVAVLSFVSGALGVIEATTATRPKDLEGSISILGEKGAVEIAGYAMDEMRTWNFVDPEPEDEVVFREKKNPEGVPHFGHREFYLEVLKCVEQGRRHMLDGIEARKSVELISAIYEAASKRAELRLRPAPRTAAGVS